MTYNPVTDFLALLRNAGGAATFAEMPGLDYVVAAMARAGMFRLWSGQSPPTVNQPTTVWLLPSSPSWVAEGTVFLWDASAAAYVLATPALWDALVSGVAGYAFQSVAVASGVVGGLTSLLAIQRDGPVATVLALPAIASRNGKALQIADWSTGVAAHAITLNPAPGSTIMRQTSWGLFSTPDQLAGVTLFPSTDLNGWVIAP